MDIDRILEKVGGFRRWHLTMFILLSFSSYMPYCWHGLIIVFIGWEPPHRCRLPDDIPVNTSIPVEYDDVEDEYALSKCMMYVNESQNENMTTGCDNGWVYDNEGFYTIVEQWDLVCEHNYLSEISQLLFLGGYLVATLSLTFVVDRFGRKRVIIVTQVMICLLGICTAFVERYAVFVTLKVVVGMFVIVNLNAGLTYLMELFDARRRAFAGIGQQIPWVCCLLTLPLMAYYVRNWRYLQVIISASSAVWIIFIWILPESPLWLMAMGRHMEAEEVLRKMAKWNGVPLDDEEVLLDHGKFVVEVSIDENSPEPLKQVKKDTAGLYLTGGTGSVLVAEKDKLPDRVHIVGNASADQLLYDQQSNDKFDDTDSVDIAEKFPILALLKDKYLCTILMVSNMLMFANCLVYYGLVLSSPSLDGNRFVNFIIMALVEIPAGLLAIFTADKFGRRLSMCVFHILAGIPLAFVLFLPDETENGTDLTPLVIAIIIFAKFCINGSFGTVLLFTKELFPTDLRGTGSGFCQVLGNVGGMISPFAAYLAKTHLYWLPNVVFGSLSIFVGLLVLVLPETRRQPLPQTTRDVHLMFKSRSFDLCDSLKCNKEEDTKKNIQYISA